MVRIISADLRLIVTLVCNDQMYFDKKRVIISKQDLISVLTIKFRVYAFHLIWNGRIWFCDKFFVLYSTPPTLTNSDLLPTRSRYHSKLIPGPILFQSSFNTEYLDTIWTIVLYNSLLFWSPDGYLTILIEANPS